MKRCGRTKKVQESGQRSVDQGGGTGNPNLYNECVQITYHIMQ